MPGRRDASSDIDDYDATPQRRAPRAPQSSQRKSKSRGKKRARNNDEDEDGAFDSDASQNAGSGKDVDTLAHDLVRLALFAENSRGSLKRDEINKRVFGGAPRLFNEVFKNAQRILGDMFGLEMVELMTRNERDAALAPGDANGKGKKKKTVTGSSKSYILRSILDQRLIEAAIQPDAKIRTAAFDPAADTNDPDYLPPDDTLISWCSVDEPTVTGILHVILALILFNGRSIPDPLLRSHLKKLHLPSGGGEILTPSPRFTSKAPTIETLLTQLTKQGYLDRQKTSLPGEVAGQKRAATTNDEEGAPSGGADIEWRWGSRSIAEINEMGVARFVSEFMGEQLRGDNDEEEDADGEEKTEERLKVEKSVMKDLERSAGGALMEIKIRRYEVEGDE